MVLSLRRSCLVSHVILLIYALLATAVFCAASDNNQTYYEILGLAPNAKLRDIKKAYRRLAMEHHPDRNKGSEEEATLKFRQVSEAYEVLSDDKLRREYDMDLKSGRAGGSAGNGQQQRQQWRSSGGWAGHRPHRDPFAQFNDLFQNDPFFKDAFEGLDDLFAKTFQQGGPNSDGGRAFGRAATNEKQKQGGWGQRVANMMGGNVQFSFSSSTSTSTGNGRTRSYSSSSSSSRGGGSSYTSRSTRTEIINGRRITVQSLEKDGNRIEERYDGTKLVERKVNGMKQRLEEIAGDDL